MHVFIKLSKCGSNFKKQKTKKVKKCPNNPARKKKCNWPLTWKIGLSLQTTSTMKCLLQKKELSSICPN